MIDMLVSLFQLWVWIFEKKNYKIQMSWIYLRVCSFSQNELKCALNIFMDLVSLEWCLVYSSEVKDREGPTPGIGLWWGATEVSNFEFSPNESFELERLVNFQIWSVTLIFHCFSRLERLRCFCCCLKSFLTHKQVISRSHSLWELLFSIFLILLWDMVR